MYLSKFYIHFIINAKNYALCIYLYIHTVESGKQSDLVYKARKNAKNIKMLFSALLSIKLMKNIGKLA